MREYLPFRKNCQIIWCIALIFIFSWVSIQLAAQNLREQEKKGSNNQAQRNDMIWVLP